MDGSKAVIIGAQGQLGQALQITYPNAQHVDREQLDITNRQSVEDFDWSGIQVILNTAAYTNVDGAESEQGRKAAWSVNADAVSNLVAVAAQQNMTLVHVSSDYVFDGTISPHTEDEGFSPLSTYGASKAAGDLLVSLAPKYYLLRTSWVIGNGKNFVRTMLELGKKGISPTVVADQIGRLSFTSELVRAIDHLFTTNAAYGTYNVSNGGDPVSWADITREIFRLAHYDLTVTDVSTKDYFANKTGVASRPLQSTLNLSKLQSTGFQSKDWQADLEDYIKQELAP